MTAPMIHDDQPEQYRGPLGQLIHLLSREAQGMPPDAWTRRRLERGAVVSLCRKTDGTRLLLLSRGGPPPDESKRAAWDREVFTFLRWFGAMRWEPVDELPDRAFIGFDVGVWNAFRGPALRPNPVPRREP